MTFGITYICKMYYYTEYFVCESLLDFEIYGLNITKNSINKVGSTSMCSCFRSMYGFVSGR